MTGRLEAEELGKVTVRRRRIYAEEVEIEFEDDGQSPVQTSLWPRLVPEESVNVIDADEARRMLDDRQRGNGEGGR